MIIRHAYNLAIQMNIYKPLILIDFVTNVQMICLIVQNVLVILFVQNVIQVYF